jgi:carbon-monoxide dehydrogenase large subunit
MSNAFALRPRNIGARVQRTEDPRLLTGQGRFTDDCIVPGALHVAFRRSDYAHAVISSIAAATAAEMPGVFAVYTAPDLEGLVEPLRATSRMKDYHATALYPLARGKVRYVGEPVVAVLAESRYLAEDALDLIEIDYDPLDAVVDPETAVGGDAPLLHEEAGTNVLVAREFARGDADAAMAAAAVRVGGRFRFRRKTPAAIENRACLAEYDRGRGSLTLTLSSQIPGIIRDLLVDLLNMPGHSVRVIAPEVGGGFGGKASIYPEEILVAVLARHLGRPSWRSTMTAISSRSRPKSSAMSGPIRSTRGRLRWSRSRSPASCPAPTGSRSTAAGCAPSRRARRRPGRIAASAGRSRPSSWSG